MRRLSSLLLAIVLPLACAQAPVDKLDELLNLVHELRAEVQQLRSEIQELKGRPPYQLPVQTPLAVPLAPAPGGGTAASVPVWRDRPLPPDQNSDPGAGAAARQRNWATLGMNVSPGQTGQSASFTTRARFFRAFGSNSEYFALQSEGLYSHFNDRQEGQFDIGLVGRVPIRHWVGFQAGGFASFEHVRIASLQAGATLGQFAGTFELIPSKWGRLGAFMTRSFLDDAVLKTVGTEQYLLKVANQTGVSGTLAIPYPKLRWFWIDASYGILSRADDSFTRYNTFNGTPSAYHSSDKSLMTRLTIPIPHAPLAFTFDGAYNESLLAAQNPVRLAFGLQFRTWQRPETFGGANTPAPVEIPRIKYEVTIHDLAADLGPVANPGPSRSGVSPGLVTLDGSASVRAVRFLWSEISHNDANLNKATSAVATFTAKPGTTYIFQLQVSDSHGANNSVRITISTLADATISTFTATPPNLTAGESGTLRWVTQNADSVTLESTDIAGVHTALGKVNASDVLVVRPLVTTTYKLTAQLSSGTAASANATITVGAVKPVILSFVAAANTVRSGSTTALTWTTQGAVSATLNGKSVSVNGTQQVTITTDTTYTLVASNGNPTDDVKATVTIHASLPNAPLIVNFTSSETSIFTGDSVDLRWAVQHADSVTISGIGTVPASGSKTVKPTGTTTYTLTATNAGGISAATVTVSVLGLPQIQSFSANPPKIVVRYDSTLLTWTTTNAETVTITGIGRVPLSGSIAVAPTQTTPYVLVASSGNGAHQVSQQITVVVDYPSPFGGATTGGGK